LIPSFGAKGSVVLVACRTVATMGETPSDIDILLAFRGPLVLILVASFWLISLLSTLSWNGLFGLVFLLLGLTFTLMDAARFTKRHVKTLFDELILDDVLRFSFESYHALIQLFVGAVVGHTGLYALPFSQEQRVQLIQSCLSTTNEKAKKIFTTPGGVHEMLPKSMVQWLNPESEAPTETMRDVVLDKPDGSPAREPVLVEVNSMSSEACETSHEELTDGDSRETEASLNRAGISDTIATPGVSGEDTAPRGAYFPKDRPIPGAKCPSPMDPIQTPMEVLASIFKEWVVNALEETKETVPDRVLAGLSVAATVACVFRLYSSRQARRIVFGLIDGSLVLALAGVASCSAAALSVRLLADPKSGALSRLSTSSVADVLKFAVSEANFKKWQAIISIIVLYYIGRPKRRRQ